MYKYIIVLKGLDYAVLYNIVLSTKEKSIFTLREGILNSDDVVLKRIKIILMNGDK